MPSDNPILEAALEYASRGWHVLPLHGMREGRCTCGNFKCASPGKHPYSRLVPNGLKQATTNVNKIRDWFERMPVLNIGIATGADSNLVVLDVDPKNGGQESFEALMRRVPLPLTMQVVTGSGGAHFYFAHPGTLIRNSAGLLGPGLDIRGDGGYVVAPPSLHASGEYYEWKEDELPLAAIPAALVPQQISEQAPGSSARYEMARVIPKGTQHSTLVSFAGTMRRRGAPENVIYAALSEMNATMLEEPAPEANIRRIAESIAQYEPTDVLGALELAVEDAASVDDPAAIPFERALEEAFLRAGEAMQNPGIPGITTGFRSLDDFTLGLQKTELVILGARPSMGKTMMAMNMAEAAATEAPVYVCSAEMSGVVLAQRSLSAATGATVDAIRRGNVSQHQYDSMARELGRLTALPIHYTDRSAPTTAHIRRGIRELDAEGKKPGVVFVDYLQLLSAKGRFGKDEERVAKISSDLKAIAKDFDLCVVALAQLNRGLEHRGDKRPMLADLRQSGQMEQDADVVMFLHRPEKYGQTMTEINGVPESSEGVAEVILAKQRNGALGTVYLHFDGARMRFTNRAKSRLLTIED